LRRKRTLKTLHLLQWTGALALSAVFAVEVCTNICIGWEKNFERLAEILATERTPSP
jgi:hypothetical protein